MYLSLLYFRMVLMEQKHGEAYAATARAFSLAASTYDFEQARNKVASWSRARNLHLLARAFPGESRVVEVGCGTGEEAIYLARRGVSVIATDAAQGMIDAARTKLGRESAEVRERVALAVLPASRLLDLGAQITAHSLDGAYSSFGPLNCEADLNPVVNAMGELVKPGGRVVISLISRYCLWETLWYLVHLQLEKAFRRWSGSTNATVHAERQDERIPVYYWSASELERTFGRYFKVTRRMALPWLLPPQYLDGLLSSHPRLFRLLGKLDGKLAGLWPFYALGDHILFEMVRLPLR